MTTNQINYAKLREDRRHNAISEQQSEFANQTNRLNAQANLQNAETRKGELLETQRSNLVREGQNAQALVETARSNRAAEAEAQRTHQANELLARDNITVTQRHNVAMENYQANSLASQNYNASQDRVIRGAQVHESVRHNVVTEGQQDVSTGGQLFANISGAIANVLKFIA